MWLKYRRYKNLLTIGILVASSAVACLSPRDSATQWMAISALGLPGIAYVVEEIVWISRRNGRPCKYCGQAIHFKPFQILENCPQCKNTL